MHHINYNEKQRRKTSVQLPMKTNGENSLSFVCRPERKPEQGHANSRRGRRSVREKELEGRMTDREIEKLREKESKRGGEGRHPRLRVQYMHPSVEGLPRAQSGELWAVCENARGETRKIRVQVYLRQSIVVFSTFACEQLVAHKQDRHNICPKKKKSARSCGAALLFYVFLFYFYFLRDVQ